MVLALNATIGGTNNERVTLAITGAQAITNKYTSNFTAGVNSWSGVSSVNPTPTLTAPYSTTKLKAIGLAFHDTYIKRTITGLTNGNSYRARVTIDRWAAVHSHLSSAFHVAVAGILDGDSVAVADGGSAIIDLEFTATGASHELQLWCDLDSTGPFADSNYLIVGSVVVDEYGSGDPVQIQRTDANGKQFVRMQDGQSPDSSGAMTVDDEEFALTGTVTYVFRDRNGSTISDTVNPSGYAGPLLSSVGFLGSVTAVQRLDEYDEELSYAEAKTTLSVIGREDPLVVDRTDFAWSRRRGRLTFFASDYDEAVSSFRDRYTNGRVALLRQVTHDGMDLYHVATSIRIRPTYLAEAGWRFAVEVAYQEVDWPEGVQQGVFGWSWQDVLDGYLAWWNLANFIEWTYLIQGTMPPGP